METNKRKLKFTGENLKALTPEARVYDVVDLECRGLILRVRPASNRHPQGTKTFYCRYRLLDGKQTMKKLGDFGVITAQQARKQATITRADVLHGKDPQADKKESKQHTLESFLSECYGPWVMSNRKTGDATLARIKAAFRGLLGKKLAQLSPWLVDKWRSERKGAGVGVVTLNRDVAALKAAVAQAVRWGYLKENPIAGVKLERSDRRPVVRYLEPKEETALRAALDAREENIRRGRDNANNWRRKRGYEELQDLARFDFADHLKPMVLVSLNTGIRRGELLSLRWADVDMIGRRLTVRGAVAKSGSTRYVPLNNEALATLKAWRAQTAGDDLVFDNDGTAFTHVKTSWHSVLRAAGLFVTVTDTETGDKRIRYTFRWHDMRHHFASMLVMRGVDLNTVRELLGHADLKMTLRYAHLGPDHLAAAVNVLDWPAGEVVEFPTREAGWVSK